MWKFFWFIAFIASAVLCCAGIFYQKPIEALVALVLVVASEGIFMIVSAFDDSIW